LKTTTLTILGDSRRKGYAAGIASRCNLAGGRLRLAAFILLFFRPVGPLPNIGENNACLLEDTIRKRTAF